MATTNEPFPCLPRSLTPSLRHQFLSSHCSHFPERFQGIIALTNHPLGSGAREIDVPSFQNNGGALWGASWCHNFSGWQAGQVCFGPGSGGGPMKTQSGRLNQSTHRGGTTAVWAARRHAQSHSPHWASWQFLLGENQASLSPRSWVMPHCLSAAVSRQRQVQKTAPTPKKPEEPLRHSRDRNYLRKHRSNIFLGFAPEIEE